MVTSSKNPHRNLHRKKRFALILLILAFGLFLLGSILGHYNPHWYWRALVAFSEAALVGGLADWFAVVALFRHPMGIPIPHTAIIPTNKDKIGEALADFVRDHFLTRDQLVARIEAFDPAWQLAKALSSPKNAGWIAGMVATQAPRFIDSLDNDALRQRVRAALIEKGGRLDVATFAGRLVGFLSNDSQRHQDALNGILRMIAEELRKPALREVLTDRVRDELGTFIRSIRVDRLIAEPVANKIANGALGQIDEILTEPHHPLRIRVVEHLRRLSVEMEHDQSLRTALEQGRDQILRSDELATYVDELWRDLLDWARNDLASETSTIKARITASMRGVGTWLTDNDAARTQINAWCVRTAGPLVDEYREVARDYIAERVKQWSADDMSGQIELGIGADLQYIRYNGTLIGGMIGLVLFGSLELIKALLG
ncbi:MAG: DUF445 domain-containing protein [Thermomonas sp.]